MVAVGETVIELPVKPPVHVNVPLVQAIEVKVTLLPAHIVLLLAVILGWAGLAITVIVVAKLESLLQVPWVQSTL